MANAEIADCYKDLVLEEEESNLKDETIEGRRNNEGKDKNRQTNEDYR